MPAFAGNFFRERPRSAVDEDTQHLNTVIRKPFGELNRDPGSTPGRKIVTLTDVENLHR